MNKVYTKIHKHSAHIWFTSARVCTNTNTLMHSCIYVWIAHTQCSTNNNSYKHEFKPLTTDKFEYFVSSWYEELATLTRSSYFSLAFFVVHMFFRFRSICTREWKWTYGVGGGGGGDNGGATLFSIIILIINIVFIVDFQNMLHVISARCISSSNTAPHTCWVHWNTGKCCKMVIERNTPNRSVAVHVQLTWKFRKKNRVFRTF